jgi:pyruvate dehydrogenase E2 component (dihydrolipoamide acetyltransferase)
MHEVRLPQLGQSVEEASIVQWLKAEGDSVKQGEPLASIQTDKAEIEFESPASGTLRRILVGPDVTVPVMTVIALIGDPNEALPDLSSRVAPATLTAVTPPKMVHPIEGQSASSEATSPAARRGISPRARKRARDLRVNPAAVRGSGAAGRVIEADVEAYAARATTVRINPAARRLAQASGIDITRLKGSGPGGRITKADVVSTQVSRATRRVPLTPMRKTIARRMAESFYSAPHYYVSVEVDMGAVVQYRASLPWKASYNDIVLRAATLALLEFPQVNARWVGDAIEEEEDINLGFAVALPTGLIVPVVRRTQTKTLRDISDECRALTNKARAGKLLPDDYAGNTFTISNMGGFGVDQFTAIINQPDSAILAVGQIKDRPVAIDGAVHVRPTMHLTLSSDHRVIDGAVAAQFMGKLKAILESAAFGPAE